MTDGGTLTVTVRDSRKRDHDRRRWGGEEQEGWVAEIGWGEAVGRMQDETA